MRKTSPPSLTHHLTFGTVIFLLAWFVTGYMRARLVTLPCTFSVYTSPVTFRRVFPTMEHTSIFAEAGTLLVVTTADQSKIKKF